MNVVTSLEQFYPGEDAQQKGCGRVGLIRHCGRVFLASVS
jgi:hypothetical protein